MKHSEKLIWVIIFGLGLSLTHYLKVVDLETKKSFYNEYVECVRKPVPFDSFKNLTEGERVLLMDRACNSGNGGSYE